MTQPLKDTCTSNQKVFKRNITALRNCFNFDLKNYRGGRVGRELKGILIAIRSPGLTGDQEGAECGVNRRKTPGKQKQRKAESAIK